MKALYINISPFYMVEILDCCIEKLVNEHMEAYVSGYIVEDEILRKLSSDTEVSIDVTDEEGSVHSIFKGVICQLARYQDGNLIKLEIWAKSKTILLEAADKMRFFYNKNQTYKEIVRYIAGTNDRSSVIFAAESNNHCNAIVQYQETDWAFLKRLASKLQMPLISDCTNSNICFFFGLPEKKSNTLEFISYELRNLQGIQEYIVESREILNLCTPIEFQGSKLYIYGIESKLYRGELMHKYRLRKKSGFTVKTQGNERIIGASIMGNVSEVRHEMIRIKCDCSRNVNGEKTVWFPYASVYSSPNGTGWYCMPEKGDRIRLYCPDDEEKHAYAVNAVHLECEGNLRKNPEEKSLRTKYDKEIRFTPDKIMITNHKGLSIVLDDEKGIFIKSNKSVEITATDGIDMESGGEISIVAGSGIIFRENSNSLVIKDGISQTGLTVQYQ